MNKIFSKLPALLLTLVVGALASSTAFAQATIVIENVDAVGVGFNDPTAVSPIGGNPGTTIGQQRLNAFQHAAGIWGAALPTGQTITVRANWPHDPNDPNPNNRPLPCEATSGTLGSAGSVSLFRNFPGAPYPDTWFGSAQANTIAGTDLDPITPEIRARFNIRLGTPGCLENSHWYYGLDTNTDFRGINLVTVLLHEFGHGLGFQTFTSSGDGRLFNGFASVYDRFLFDNTTNKNWTQMTNAERMASAINTGNLVWNGPQVIGDATLITQPTTFSAGRDAQGRLLMHAPNPVQGGSSVSHWSTTVRPRQLMEPNITSGLSHSVRPPEDLTFSLLTDVGWCVSNCPPPPSPTPTPPEPANNNFANAQLISGCSGSVAGTNVGANKEAGEPSHDPLGDAGGGSVWYQWTAPASSSITITTDGSDYDTMLGVYTGDSVNASALTVIGKNDDVDTQGGNVSSIVTFNATAGTVYRIAVDGWGGGRGSITLNWTQTNCSVSNPALQFNASSFSVNEGGGTLQVNVSRSGDSSAAATVDFATSDTAGLAGCKSFNTSKASERCDYVTSVGTLRFAAGETSKSFTITIIDDVHLDGNEAFTVSLSNAVGASLGTPSTAPVMIIDNDAVTATQNPIDGVDFFIRQQYLDLLNRQPDAGGFANWQATLGNCPNGGFGEFDNPSCDRVHVSMGFFQSTEFLGRGYFVFRFYMAAFGQRPTYAQFIPDMAKVGGPKSPAEEELSKTEFADKFVLRPEFVTRYGALTDPTQYVDALLQTAGLPNLSIRQQLITGLTNGTKTRGRVLREIAESQEALDRFLVDGTVAIQYFGYLRRDPDTIGYNNWITTLRANPNDIRHMVFGFIFSSEYRSRFGP